MPKMHFCWRCKEDRPFFDEREWSQIEPIAKQRVHAIKAHRAKHRSTLSEAVHAVDSRAEFGHFPLLAGHPNANPTDLWHHRLAKHGPPCNVCGKLLRTPRARRCVECGAAVAV
jgi:hypothetical protein